MVEQTSTCSPWKTPCWRRGMCPKGGCGPVGSPRWSRLLARPVAPWREEPTLERSVPEGLHPVEGTHAGAVCEELQPVGRTHVGEVHGGVSHGRDPTLEQGKSVKSLVAEDVFLIFSFISLILCF